MAISNILHTRRASFYTVCQRIDVEVNEITNIRFFLACKQLLEQLKISALGKEMMIVRPKSQNISV